MSLRPPPPPSFPPLPPSAPPRSFLETRGDFILVGDMMKSLSLLRYRPEAGALEEVAADPGQAWLTAVAVVDDATFLGADADYNLFSAVRNLGGGGSETDEARSRLDISGTFHLGDMVNRFRPGSLVPLPPEQADAVAVLAAETARLQAEQQQLGQAAVAASAAAAADAPAGGAGSKRARSSDDAGDSIKAAGASGLSPAAAAAVEFLARVPRPRFVYGTVGGAVGAILSLPPPVYVKLRLLQRSLARTVQAAGGLSHSSWRAWHNRLAPLAIPPQLLGGGGGGTGEGGYDDASAFDDGSVNGGATGALPADATRGFIDGDLVERFLELPRPDQERVVADMNARGSGVVSDVAPVPAQTGAGAAAAVAPSAAPLITVEDVSRLVEELQRLH